MQARADDIAPAIDDDFNVEDWEQALAEAESSMASLAAEEEAVARE